MAALAQFQAAGTTSISDTESSAACLQPDLDPRHRNSGYKGTEFISDPANDPKYKYKKSYQHQPGLRFIHPGLADVNLNLQSTQTTVTHGLVTDKGSRAGDCFYQVPETELQQYLQEQREHHYRSRQREPIGSGYIRGHSLPDHTKSTEFRFGINTQSKSESAKNLIYKPDANTAAEAELLKTEAKDNISISNLPISEERKITRQIDRQYNWDKTGINPQQHRFGKPAELIDYTGKNVAESLKHEILGQTNIVSSQIIDVRSHSHDYLGRTRYMRGAVAAAESKHLNETTALRTTYGRSSTYNDWGARDCIKGNYSDLDQQPDKDLGLSVRKLDKRENIPAEQQNRVFGLPSVRFDRKPALVKSVANDMNYGDESDGKGLLYPAPFASSGVNEEEFLMNRSIPELRAVFASIGHQFTDTEFNNIYSQSKQWYGPSVSIDSFRHTMNRLRLQRENELIGNSKSGKLNHGPINQINNSGPAAFLGNRK